MLNGYGAPRLLVGIMTIFAGINILWDGVFAILVLSTSADAAILFFLGFLLCPMGAAIAGGTTIQPKESEPTERPTPKSSTAAKTARSILEIFDLVVPRRISDEDVGDALESISFLEEEAKHPQLIYLATASTIFWVSVSIFRELSSSLLGKKSAASSKKP